MYNIVAYKKRFMENNKEIELKQSQIKKGVLAYCVLLSIEKSESYALNILQNLKVANIIIVEGTLYPLLSRFKREKLLNYEWRESKNWPPRKYYTLTDKWKKTLEALHITWADLVETINSLTKISWKR